MADETSDLQRIIVAANKRVIPNNHFPPAVVKFAQKVDAWFSRYSIPVTVERFKATFLTLGMAKVGFRGYVEKMVPIVHTTQEFELLMQEIGYDTDDTDYYEEDPIRVLISGDRNFKKRKFISYLLRQLPPSTIIIEGAADGVDSIVAEVAESLGMELEEYPAQWKVHGKAAGPLRNQQMLDEGKPDVVIGIHPNIAESKGTRDMLKRAKREGVPYKLLTGRKRFDLMEWIEEQLEEEEEEEDEDE